MMHTMPSLLLSSLLFSAPLLAFPLQDVLSSTLVERSITGPQMTTGAGANFPDPSIVQYNGAWYSFATRTIGANPKTNVPLAKSPDFKTWQIVNNTFGNPFDALPVLPAWIPTDVPDTKVWAPDVSQLDDGSWIMYFSALSAQDPTKHCIGAARSLTIQGPYTADARALVCPLSEGGAIDPAGFKDTVNGVTKRYLAYKVDGNSLGAGGPCGNTVGTLKATPLRLQQVGADGTTFIGSYTTMLNHNGVSDDGIVEAPSLAKGRYGLYFLFFSSGCFSTDHYTVSYATSNSITGAFTRVAQPILKTGSYGLNAPGGASVASDNKHIVFHAGPFGARRLWTMEAELSGGKVNF